MTTPVRADEAKCPSCGGTATSASGISGWLFYCAPCRYGWGHPQLNDRQYAIDCLRMARAADSAKRLPK